MIKETVPGDRVTIHLASKGKQKPSRLKNLSKSASGYEILQWRSLEDYTSIGDVKFHDPLMRDSRADEYCKSQWADTVLSNSRWYGVETIEEAYEIWAEGYMGSEITAMGEGLASKAEGLVVQRRRRRVYGPQAGELDADRWANGARDMAFVSRPRRGSKTSPIVTLAFAWGGNSSRKASELRWTGVAASALCYSLEAAGWRVGLTAMPLNRGWVGKDWWSAHLIPVKQPEEPLRPGQVGAMFCHPASFRIKHFYAMMAQWVSTGQALGSMRTLPEIPSEMREDISQRLPGNTIFVDAAFNEGDAMAAVVKALEQVANPMRMEV
tara:strand:- start:4996 stop:5967 length:972 start_codon:yes stop_codon:yes gene_type:complete